MNSGFPSGFSPSDGLWSPSGVSTFRRPYPSPASHLPIWPPGSSLRLRLPRFALKILSCQPSDGPLILSRLLTFRRPLVPPWCASDGILILPGVSPFRLPRFSPGFHLPTASGSSRCAPSDGILGLSRLLSLRRVLAPSGISPRWFSGPHPVRPVLRLTLAVPVFVPQHHLPVCLYHQSISGNSFSNSCWLVPLRHPLIDVSLRQFPEPRK